MKYLFTLLFLVACTATNAQQQRKGSNTLKPQKEKLPNLHTTKSEIGIDAGYCPIEYGGGPTSRIAYYIRTQKHLQLFAGADAVLSGLRTDIGIGAGVNFPFGSQESYFYPGIYLGNYFGTSIVVGGQLGYVGYVSKNIALHIEGGYRWGRSGGTLSSDVTYVPIIVGIRFYLD